MRQRLAVMMIGWGVFALVFLAWSFVMPTTVRIGTTFTGQFVPESAYVAPPPGCGCTVPTSTPVVP